MHRRRRPSTTNVRFENGEHENIRISINYSPEAQARTSLAVKREEKTNHKTSCIVLARGDLNQPL